MSNRVNSLTVILETTIRDDDAEDLAEVIRRMRGVAQVKLGPVADVSVYSAKLEERHRIRRVIAAALAEDE